MRAVLLASSAMLLLAQPVLAQDAAQPLPSQQAPAEQMAPPVGQTSTATATQLAEADKTFVTEAAQGGLLEVQLGGMATQQADNQAVKECGQRMVDDHGKANGKLKELAQQKGMTLPNQLSEKGQQHQQALAQLSGAEFNQAYVKLMVEDHEKDVKAFQQFTETGQDQALVAFAQETLPTLQQHLTQIQQIQEQTTASTAQPNEARPDGAQPGAQPAADMAKNATAVVGTEVVNASGQSIGEIEDVVIDQQKKPYAIVSVGGFLGIGDKEVALSLDQLEPGSDGQGFQTAMTEDQLKQLPEYDQGLYSSMVQ